MDGDPPVGLGIDVNITQRGGVRPRPAGKR